MILVTGATGFVGSALVARLATDGMPVRVARRRPGVHGERSAVMGDIGPDADWSSALEGCSVVVHLAARVHVMRETAADPLASFRAVNVAGTERLARQAIEAGVVRFVFVSTVKVHGESCATQPFTEADPPAPRDAYALSKWEAELALERLSREAGLAVTVLRPPLVYGPGAGGNGSALGILSHGGC